MLVAYREGRVIQVSRSVEKFLGVSAESAIGMRVGDVADPESGPRIVQRMALSPDELRAANPFRIVVKDKGSFDAYAHYSNGAFVLELEPVAVGREATIGSFDPALRASAVRLQSARTVESLTSIAAAEVRKLTGFDRVMVYRFDADWNGEVVAEDKRADLEPFLGLHYPASDIPAQARRLYTVNPLRLIGDIGYQPSPIVPVLDPATNAPLDLSHSQLRSVSPIHVEYLRNMGVTASMSVSLVIDGKLAGLIACHHYSGPHIVPVTVRDTAEFIAYQLSWQLRVLEEVDRAERTRIAQEHEAEMVRSIAVAGELLDGLDNRAMLKLTAAMGAAIVLEEGIRRIGDTPNEEAIVGIVATLKDKPEVYATDSFGGEGGLLAVAIAQDIGEYILWFRPPEDRIVNWAGDPAKQVTTTATGAPRLSPRGSFALWKETIKGRARPWEPWEIEAASRLRRAILGGVRRRAVQLRAINQRLIDADRAKDDFIATVSHELRTPLSAITGWTQLLKRGVEQSRIAYAIEVIDRNAQAQAQLVEDLLDVSRITSGKLTLDVAMIDVGVIVANVIESMTLAVEAKAITLTREVEAVPKVRGDAVRLRQIIANLLTNAVKFTPKGGAISVRLAKSGSDVELMVTDTGQGITSEFLPHIFEAFRQEDAKMNRRSQGLGLGLAIARHLVELHGGQISAASEGEKKGSTFRVTLPITPFLATPSTDRLSPPPDSPKIRNELEGKTVLVVEDDTDSRELIRVIIASAGAQVTTVNDAKTALGLLASSPPFDIIVSDVGMPDIDGLDFMKRYRAATAHKTPAIALTAFTRPSDRTAALQAGFQSHVPKPVDPDELVATIVALLT
jgi:chemotaxis family two-component system sensor kinase Cph1